MRYTAPDDAKEVKAWIGRVHATGGSASLAEAYPVRVLAVVNGRPSALMDLVTWVAWQSKSARKGERDRSSVEDEAVENRVVVS